jgi:hypothetical protein
MGAGLGPSGAKKAALSTLIASPVGSAPDRTPGADLGRMPHRTTTPTEVPVMLHVLVTLQILVLSGTDRLRERLTREEGQSTAEYALVLLGAAGVALLLVAWATKSGKITKLLNSVLDHVLAQVS